MNRVTSVVICVVATLSAACGGSDVESSSEPLTAEQISAARAAWDDVYSVLTHPRCMNCHPEGDAPLQTDASTVHKWGIDRDAIAGGLECSSCHAETNGVGAGTPPGAPHWGFPPADTPMIFEGRDPLALCEQFHDTRATGGRDLQDLLHHVEDESLVQWAWNPGGDRTTPPISRDAFVEAFAVWVAGGGACPEPEDEASALSEEDAPAADGAGEGTDG